MRRLALLAALAVALAPLARGEDRKPTKLPLNPFAKAKAGDWAVWTGSMTGAGVPPDAKLTMFRTVEKVEGDKVTTSYTETMNGEGQGEARTEVFDTKDLTLERYLKPGDENKQRPPLDDVKVDAEKRKVGGKEFACKKVVAKTKDGAGEVTLTLWLCEDVKAGGLVAMELRFKAEKGEMVATFEIAGYGPKGGKPDWGKSIDDVKAADKKAPKKEEPAAPKK